MTVKTTTAPTFPVDVLDGCRTALVLFAAAFGGRQDAAFIEAAGLRATCVDRDVKALLRMREHYPENWDFIVGDAFEFPFHTTKRWDVVTVDVFTSDFRRAARMIGEWCQLARKAVVLGAGPMSRVDAPDGWIVRDWVKRSDFEGGVYWAVLVRE